VSDQEWDVDGFVARCKDGEFDGRLGNAIDSLSQGQFDDLERFLLREGESIWASAYRA
jgi:hypothetical protein